MNMAQYRAAMQQWANQEKLAVQMSMIGDLMETDVQNGELPIPGPGSGHH